jgi:hypothetical protein
LSQTFAVSDRHSPCTGEELHDTEGSVFYVQPTNSELVIHAVNMNPREKVCFHDSPDGGGKYVIFAFRLGHHASVDIIEVKADHLLLRDVRRWGGGFLDWLEERKEVIICVPFAVIASDVKEMRTADQVPF